MVVSRYVHSGCSPLFESRIWLQFLFSHDDGNNLFVMNYYYRIYTNAVKVRTMARSLLFSATVLLAAMLMLSASVSTASAVVSQWLPNGISTDLLAS